MPLPDFRDLIKNDCYGPILANNFTFLEKVAQFKNNRTL